MSFLRDIDQLVVGLICFFDIPMIVIRSYACQVGYRN
jgi:hypothetical protein